MMFKEARTILAVLGLVLVVLAVAGGRFHAWYWTALAWADVALMVFIVFFFRNPARTIPPGDQLVLSPADGTIIVVADAREDEFVQGHCTKISIFLSVFNVHVNRVPVSGVVQFHQHRPGKFAMAFAAHASTENECNAIGIQHGSYRIFFKQITGFVARRIVSYLTVGQNVKGGEIFGMMKFGSRVDLYLPKDARINVKLGDKVRAGETILGELP
jgi:phosphatidylserine decarboxylase